jgi:hypothetical protein
VLTATNKQYSYLRVAVIQINVHPAVKTWSTHHTLSMLGLHMTFDHTYLTWSTYSNISWVVNSVGQILLLLRKSAPDSTSQPDWAVCGTCLSFSPNTTIEEEYGTLMSNGTWELVSWPRGSNIVIDKWIFTHKFLFDGTFNHNKSHWVLRGFTEWPGWLRWDFQRTHGAFHCCLLWLADSTTRYEERLPRWHSQWDLLLQSAHGIHRSSPSKIGLLPEQVFIWTKDPMSGTIGLPHIWSPWGFVEVKSDTSLFILRHGSETVYLSFYVNDIILTVSWSFCVALFQPYSGSLPWRTLSCFITSLASPSSVVQTGYSSTSSLTC